MIWYPEIMTKNTIASLFASLVFLLPVSAAASTDAQLISLYQQLVAVLSQQLQLLTAQPAGATLPVLSIESPEGTAPYAVLFALSTTTGRDAVDFGDGHSTWTDGCAARAANGWCPVRTELAHTYFFAGTYTVRLFSQDPKTPIATTTVRVK